MELKITDEVIKDNLNKFNQLLNGKIEFNKIRGKFSPICVGLYPFMFDELIRESINKSIKMLPVDSYCILDLPYKYRNYANRGATNDFIKGISFGVVTNGGVLASYSKYYHELDSTCNDEVNHSILGIKGFLNSHEEYKDYTRIETIKTINYGLKVDKPLTIKIPFDYLPDGFNKDNFSTEGTSSIHFSTSIYAVHLPVKEADAANSHRLIYMAATAVAFTVNECMDEQNRYQYSVGDIVYNTVDGDEVILADVTVTLEEGETIEENVHPYVFKKEPILSELDNYFKLLRTLSTFYYFNVPGVNWDMLLEMPMGPLKKSSKRPFCDNYIHGSIFRTHLMLDLDNAISTGKLAVNQGMIVGIDEDLENKVLAH